MCILWVSPTMMTRQSGDIPLFTPLRGMVIPVITHGQRTDNLHDICRAQRDGSQGHQERFFGTVSKRLIDHAATGQRFGNRLCLRGVQIYLVKCNYMVQRRECSHI